MNPNIFNEANKIWKRVASNENVQDLKFSLEVHKKLLSFFQVGDFYYYVFNIKESAFDFISKEIFSVLGYHPEEVDIPFFLGIMHPEDAPWFLNFENKVVEFFSTLTLEQIPEYKIRYDYRVRKKDGSYIRILQQVVTIEFDEKKGIIRTFGVHTDITHIKKEGVPVLSFIGLNGQPSYTSVNVKEKFSVNTLSLTRREQEVLALLIEGKTSDAISKLLFISKQTVHSHRKNLLQKTNCLNTPSLISSAIQKGWV